MDARDLYIDEYRDLAISTTKGTGLYPSVMLAQAIVESRNGDSTLASKYHNHFGIKDQKGDSWNGPKVNLKTKEVSKSGQGYTASGEYFRVYPSDKASYQDRVKFLQENKRYRDAGVFEAKTPLEQLKRLQSAGYATDPNYATTINNILKRENLGALDTAISFTRRNWIPLTASAVVLTTGLIFLFKFKKSIINNLNK